MTRICTICARGGSKGVPGKNVRTLCGKPLIAWSVEHARASGLFSLVVVSSDSREILEAAADAGADLCVVRPTEMATDSSGKVPAIRHCVLAAEAALGRKCEILVDLDATSPLRSIGDVCGAVRMIEETGASSVITGAPARRSPYFNLVEVDAEGFVHLSKPLDEPVLSRQATPRCFDMNASIYVWRRDIFVSDPAVFYPDTRLFEMPEDRSIDIDSELDFEFVEFILIRKTREA